MTPRALPVCRGITGTGFAAAAGCSPMRYVRGCRLTEAVRSLARGAPDILAAALESGYGSHEAFTRAFCDQFGLTPEALRAQGNLSHIELVKPIKMDEILLTWSRRDFENGKTLLIAALGQNYNSEGSAGIPAEWQQSIPYPRHIPGQIGRAAYGGFVQQRQRRQHGVHCGVEVSDF